LHLVVQKVVDPGEEHVELVVESVVEREVVRVSAQIQTFRLDIGSGPDGADFLAQKLENLKIISVELGVTPNL